MIILQTINAWVPPSLRRLSFNFHVLFDSFCDTIDAMINDILYIAFFIGLGGFLLYYKAHPPKRVRELQKQQKVTGNFGPIGYAGALFLAYGVYLIAELLIRLRQ